MNVAGIYARAAAFFAPEVPDLIQRGNSDIEDSSAWAPEHRAVCAADLPIYPTPADLWVDVVATENQGELHP